ncbi:MAG TPA: DUF4229 domain-containing protein [Actinomycetes bacterium]|nr:DUF4229 domain-containing protein [Actinomycetes bacterium]
MTEPTTWTERHPALTYTGARLAIFALIFVVLLFVVRNLFVALFTAAIASAIISIFALRKQREALSMSIATRAERANQRMAERAASEDAWDDSRRDTEGSESDSGRL